MEAALKLRLLDSRTCELIHNVRLLKCIQNFLWASHVNSHNDPICQIYYYPHFTGEEI